ncbi:MAG TPA: DoxX family protein [Gemmatimonadales bacterium]|nr:DoxX family protein [Gemmatimonadales bacterium]
MDGFSTITMLSFGLLVGRLVLGLGVAAHGPRGGLLTAVGLLGPVGPALMVAVMRGAMTQHLGNGFFAMNIGIVEVPLLYLVGALVLAVTGPGPFSVDAALGLEALHAPVVVGTVLAAAVVAGLGATALRRAGADARVG